MRRKFLSMRNIGPDYNGSVLITMAGFFMIGAIIGSFTASGIMNSGSGRLYEILTNYLSKYTGDYVRPSFLTTLFVNFRYPILIFLISFISVGVIFIPFLVMARGFFLSFAVTGFVRFLGINGAVLSFAAFGIQNLLALPVLLLLSAQSYLWAKARFQTSAGGRRLLSSKMPNICLPVISIFFVVLFVCTLIEMYLSPLLISYVQHFL